nr:MAG TPA: hypothetical protein [Caudoviricetes sp.]
MQRGHSLVTARSKEARKTENIRFSGLFCFLRQ